jgi:steroid Delta-isomerase
LRQLKTAIGFAAMTGGPGEVLEAHVRRFNEAVRSRDFIEMVDGFAPDAEMVFEGVPVGPFVGREAIAAAYARQPPDDEVRLLGTVRVNGDCAESDYAWAADGRRAGRMIVTARDGAVAHLVVTFE